MITTGAFIRDRLIEAGDKGCCIADLHKKRKQSHEILGLIYRDGTYYSFIRFFGWYKQLGFVEKTGETEVAFGKGSTNELKSPRIFYRITSEGLSRSAEDWGDPIGIVHPHWAGSLRSKKKHENNNVEFNPATKRFSIADG